MSQSVLIITGNAGFGKSTTARLWAEARGRAAIAGDDIYLWMRSREFRWKEFHQQALVAALAIEAAYRFLQAGLDVALDYVWLPSTLERMESHFSLMATVRTVCLSCEMSENQKCNAARSNGILPAAQIQSLAADLGSRDWPDFVESLDTTGLKPAEVFLKLQQMFG